MNIHHKARHIGIAGKSGMGKTEYACRYIRGSHHGRVFIFDHQDEFAERLGARPEQIVGTVEEMAAAAEKFKVVFFDFTRHYGGEKELAFDDFCEGVYALATILCDLGVNSLLVCDEIQKFCSENYASFPFKNITETGRRQMLDSLTLTQRPNKVNGSIREQWTELIMFRLQDERSLKFAAEIGADTATVMNLPPHHFLFFQTVKGEERTGEISFS